MPCRTPTRPIGSSWSLALLCGFGGGNFASSMANISFFFPKAEKGNALALNAGLGNLGVSVVQFVVPLVITAGVFGWLGGDAADGDAGRRHDHAVAAERRLRLGAVHRRQRLRRLVRHERHRLHEGLVRRAGGDLPAQAQLDHVLALYRHVRLVHRLFGGLPAARPRSCSRRSNALQYAFLGPLVGALVRARRPAGVATAIGGGRVTFWVFIAMMPRRRRRALLPSASRSSPTPSRASSPGSCSCSWRPASATPRPSR